MSKEQRENCGTLSRIKNKEENSRQPDYRGTCTIAGVAYAISGWIKEGGEDDPFLSLAFSKKDPQRRVDTRASSATKFRFRGDKPCKSNAEGGCRSARPPSSQPCGRW